MKEKMLKTYQLAYKYLVDMLPDELTEANLQKYFVGDRSDFSSLEDIFEQFIICAQDYNRMPNIIKYRERRDEIKKVLLDFDVNQIKFMNVDELYYKFRETFNITSKDSKLNRWRIWSHSVIDSAMFVSSFRDADEFRTFVNKYDDNVSTRMALPLLISQKINGIGFALACSTLKEFGFLNYAKPDVHMKDVFSQLGFSNEDDYFVFESIAEMADVCKEVDPESSPYKLDKIIWLICSGNFYLDDIKVGSHKDEFIEYCKLKLKNNEVNTEK